MAEREGFEPSVPLVAVHTISSRAPSASSDISPRLNHHDTCCRIGGRLPHGFCEPTGSGSGGEGGIRTHDPGFARILLFESRAFSHSATSPRHCLSGTSRSKYNSNMHVSTVECNGLYRFFCPSAAQRFPSPARVPRTAAHPDNWPADAPEPSSPHLSLCPVSNHSNRVDSAPVHRYAGGPWTAGGGFHPTRPRRSDARVQAVPGTFL